MNLLATQYCDMNLLATAILWYESTCHNWEQDRDINLPATTEGNTVKPNHKVSAVPNNMGILFTPLP